MTASLAALYMVNQAFYAIQAWHLKNVAMQARASGAALVSGDITGGQLNTLYIFVAWAGRFNGIAFLLYVAWSTRWYLAALLLLLGLLTGMIANTLIRMATGYTGIVVVAHAAVIGVPLTAALAWWTALVGR
jgi:hypothetical protein